MTDVTLQFAFRVADVLTNVTSVVLADDTSTYGVKRSDTDAIVVASGTAMTAASTGVYRYTFTPPVQGLTYSWVARVVYQGVTYHFEQEATDPVSVDDDLTGTYWSWVGIKSVLGKVNAEVASQLDNDLTTADTDRIEADGDTADAYTNFRARRGTPSLVTPIEDTSDDFALVQQVTNLYAAYLLARHRNWFGYSDDTKAQLVSLRGEAMDLYLELFGPARPGIDAEEEEDVIEPGGFEAVPMTFEPVDTSDEFSNG